MRILFMRQTQGAFAYITDGMINALRDKGHTVMRYDGAIATWNRFDPDLYIGCSAIKEEIPKFDRRAKVAIHVNPYGPVLINGINEQDSDIKWVSAQKPDVVFGYGFDSDRIIWQHWESKLGLPWCPMPTAADSVIFKDLQRERPLDVVYLGGRWAYKALTIDAFLVPVLRDKRIMSKLHGWGDWYTGYCSGPLGSDEVVEFFNSGKVGPCVSERHTQKHGIDVPERLWKLALCGVLPIHDPVPTLRQHLKSLLIASGSEEYLDMCYEYSRAENEASRLENVNALKSEVLGSHTYHHRMSVLFKKLGFNKEAEEMIWQ